MDPGDLCIQTDADEDPCGYNDAMTVDFPALPCGQIAL